MKRTGIAVLTALALAACGDPGVGTRDYQPEVVVMDVGSNHSDTRLYFPAIAKAAHKSALSFRVSGEISKLVATDGYLVKKGDLLARLDKTDYQLAVDNAEAKYSVADSQYRRSAQLVKKGLLAQSQFDELKAQRAIAKAELDLAKLRLSYTDLTAPFDGIVSRVSVDQFENVQPGQPIANIHRTDSVDVVIQVPDRIFTKQPKNIDLNAIEVSVRLKPGQEYQAKIKEYTTEPDPQSATYNLTLTMPMPHDTIILDGTALEVGAKNTRELNLAPRLSIPVEALFNQDGDDIDRENKFVWVVDESNIVSKTQVRTGKVIDDQVAVLSGVEPGQQIVVAGVARLRDGMEVKPVTQEAGQ